MHTYWQCKRIFELFLELHWLTCTDSHFDVRRPAKCAACDGNGQAKQGKQGKGKEGFADHSAPLSILRTKITASRTFSRGLYRPPLNECLDLNSCAIAMRADSIIACLFCIVMSWFGLVNGLKSCARFRFPNSLPSLAQCMLSCEAMRERCGPLSYCAHFPCHYARHLVRCKCCKERKHARLALPWCIVLGSSWFGLVWLNVEVVGKILTHYALIECDRLVFLRRCLKQFVSLQSPRGDLQNKLKLRNALACLG